ncbi:MAG: hypothetical protein ACRD2Q_07335, partial [Terriglobales bacterium]
MGHHRVEAEMCATSPRFPGLEWFDGIARNREAALRRAGRLTTEAQRTQRTAPGFEFQVSGKVP